MDLSTKKEQCPPGCQETGRGGCKGNSSSSVARCTLTTILQVHFTGGKTEVHRREGSLPRSHRTSKAEHRPELRLQIQGSLPNEVNLAKPGSGEQRTFSLNQRGTFRRRRKKGKEAAGEVPRAGALPSQSQGSGRVGMTQPGPVAVSGAPFTGNLPAGAARTAEAPGRMAELTARAGSAGAVCMGPSMSSGVGPSQHLQEPGHVHTHRHTGTQARQFPGEQQRHSQPGRGQPGAGKSLRASERGWPRAAVQAQLPAEAKARGCGHSQLTFLAPKAPFLSSNLRRPRPLCVLKPFSYIIAQLRLTLSLSPADRDAEPRGGEGAVGFQGHSTPHSCPSFLESMKSG